MTDKTPTDSEMLDWVLSFATGSMGETADRRTLLVVHQVLAGLDGRAAVDAAMRQEAAL